MAEFAAGPLTILFSDVEGSTDLRTQRGDAAAHRILRSHEEVVRRCVGMHDGREVKALGDGFMVAFASVRKALACAVAIQQQLEERNVESPGDEVLVRIGVNFGEVTVEGDDLYGQAVNAAARIAGKAKGGEVLVSDIVRQLVGSGPEFSFVDRGRVRLKGFPDRWHLHGVVFDTARPDGAAGSTGRTPFVGREAERAELRRLVTQVQSGAGALVMVGGEPGVGKTRLAEELTVRCAREGFLTFTGHCYEAAGAAPYIPIVETFEQALARAAGPTAFRQFLGDEAPEIAKLVPKLRQACPDIAPALELPAEQERRYLFNAVWDVLARTAAAQPTLLVLDDIHWADEPTMLLIQHCAERLAEVPVLMVGLYRDSELDAGRPLSRTFEELIRRRLAVRIPLARLSETAVGAIVAGLAGQEPPAGLVEVIYAGTEGNPFFTEEVFKHLSEEGRLFDSDGRFRADLSVEDLDVPDSVRLVVSACGASATTAPGRSGPPPYSDGSSPSSSSSTSSRSARTRCSTSSRRPSGPVSSKWSRITAARTGSSSPTNSSARPSSPSSPSPAAAGSTSGPPTPSNGPMPPLSNHTPRPSPTTSSKPAAPPTRSGRSGTS